MSVQNNVHPITGSVESKLHTVGAKAKPNRVLPTFKINFEKQVHLLRGYANAFQHYGRPVKTDEVASVTKIAATTISTANAFLLDVGLIQKNESGFLPSDELIAFNHAYEWNPDTATAKLQGLFQNTWFATHLLPKVMMRRLTEGDAVEELAVASSSPKDYKNQIKILLDYLAWVGLIQRDGEFIGKSAITPIVETATPEKQEGMPTMTETNREIQRPSAPSPVSGSMTAGAIQFSINVKVDMSEMSGWSGEQIASFFSGLADVMAVKAAIERERS